MWGDEGGDGKAMAQEDFKSVLLAIPSVECYGDYHFLNGVLGWSTIVVYCVCFPMSLFWLASWSGIFDYRVATSGFATAEKRATTYQNVVNPMMEMGEQSNKSTNSLIPTASDAHHVNPMIPAPYRIAGDHQVGPHQVGPHQHVN